MLNLLFLPRPIQSPDIDYITFEERSRKMHKLYLGRWACCAYVPNRPFLIWKTQDSERYLSLFYFYIYNNSTVWVGYTKRWWPTVKQRPYSYQFSSRPSILFAHTTYIELRQVHNNRNVMLIVGAHKHTRRTWSCFLLSFQYYFPCAFCCTLGENQLSIYQSYIHVGTSLATSVRPLY